jgi:hypothetical protein
MPDLAVFCRSMLQRIFGGGGWRNPVAGGAEEVMGFLKLVGLLKGKIFGAFMLNVF